ncbi:LysR family transcriptional regulator [Octadecabacter sp. 1_MG-2023]|uniref:LysR family transcriptional regulator n=1 Tax=unclassified Octadecabacter TaxID=196158 RepID=UPI001C0A1DCC|nr:MULTISPECIES: LysR family transcriptional regulator [unclassified Octadecabacter]MBU2992476.1 LysR family transcriptional regulator [Octadecabacter sp. B2R22]MDO6734767.1 LysR family transcriptional regulator [Octadecabacter sp. 1_MG-2023]
MLDSLASVDWSLIQAFLAVAEEGSLSGAARVLGASQPTLGRQIKTLEHQLKANLFVRQARGLVLTETGAALVGPARAMRDAMGQITLTAAGQSARIEGTVRVTASEMTSQYHLPDIIAHIREQEPEIAVELVPSDDSRNLLYREADIAVRMYRPAQLDLVTQHIGDIPLTMCAAKTYLERKGKGLTLDNVHLHDFVGFDANPAIIDGFRQAGIEVTRDFFKVRCDNNAAYWALVRSGCGVGFSQLDIALNDPLIDLIDAGFPIPPLPIWLTAHEAMRHTPRIRRVWDLLAEGLKPFVA